MINGLLKRLKAEDGSVLVIVALCMVVLLGMTALVTDVGLIYLKETRLKAATDAGALAGAQELPYYPEEAVAKAVYFAEMNGADPGTISATVGPNSKTLTLTASNRVNLVFARVLGFMDKQVTTSSEAGVGAIKKVGGVMPLAVTERPPEDPYRFGQEYLIKTDGTSGWFGFAALGGTGNKILEGNLMTGYLDQLEVGQIIETESGYKADSTGILRTKIAQDPHYPKCTAESYTAPCPRVITIMVITDPIKTGRSDADLLGFASFLLTDAYEEGTGTNNVKIIKGFFLREVASGEIDMTKEGYGLNGVKLLQ
ncbi:MAG TPA: pilus assembly protein TadG-related protein [Bacillota bacterium]|nr:pilus assembly protein TadG-related protein [Bacillota bacterium]